MRQITSSQRADKFGSANAAERDLGVGFVKNSNVTTDNGGNAVALKALKEYFDNLSAAATNKKTVLKQLVASNAKLASTNKELVAVVGYYDTDACFELGKNKDKHPPGWKSGL